MTRSLFLGWWLALVWSGFACNGAAGHLARDAGMDGSSPVEDSAIPDAEAGTDARPEGALHDFCGLPLMKVPIDGQGGDLTLGIHLDGHAVVYVSRPSPYALPCDVRLLDLELCREFKLTEAGEANSVWNAGKNVYYADSRGSAPWAWVRNIYRFDLDAWTEYQVTDNLFGEVDVQGSEEYLLFMRAEDQSNNPPMALIMKSTLSGEERLLAAGWASAAYYDTDGVKVAFAAYTNDPQSVERDVFVHDIATNETVHLDSTYAGVQDWVTLRGDYLAYTVLDSFASIDGILMLHHLPSGAETTLVGPEAAVGAAAMDGKLVAYNTNRYQGSSVMFPSDVELYDIETGERRRVTAEPSNLRAAYLSFPYLLFTDWLLGDILVNDYYVAHLVRLGITDEAGHLLPGDGVVLSPREP